ncbi:hypothetical protein TrLO_g13949 [Triparma laevis f. longispina]|uniref:Uncharacterized protein n=1 Tax=Triparma laevis f. longispina TaxID=1714387 RepID=A0A9W7F6X3_9STRA|nr:hypothetical protein TrLO_g13949 [Triparma laevis f. longispina]
MASAQAFMPLPPFVIQKSPSCTSISSAPEPPEGEGLDLDLGEMFQMFDAADNEDDFDEAVKAVKGDGDK